MTDVLGNSTSSVVAAIIIMFACIAAFAGVVIWTIRLKHADVTEMSRIPLDEAQDVLQKGGSDNG